MQDSSRLRFLLLLAGLTMFNLANLINTGKMPNLLINSELRYLIISATGVTIAGYFLIYLMKEFKIYEVKIKGSYTLGIFLLAYVSGFLTLFFNSGHFALLTDLLIPIPLFISILFCFGLEVQIRKQKIRRKGNGQLLMIYSGYGGIILMMSTPIFIQLGFYHIINVSLINVLFFLTITAYVHGLALRDREEYKKLALIGFFAESKGLGDYGLSDREQEVARLILDGLKYWQIGEVLFIDKSTVAHHARNIFIKTQTKDLYDFRREFKVR